VSAAEISHNITPNFWSISLVPQSHLPWKGCRGCCMTASNLNLCFFSLANILNSKICFPHRKMC